jgi:hypothetical protein
MLIVIKNVNGRVSQQVIEQIVINALGGPGGPTQNLINGLSASTLQTPKYNPTYNAFTKC